MTLRFILKFAVKHFSSRLTYFGFIAGNRLDWELDICRFQYGVLLQNVLLWLIMAERLNGEKQSFNIMDYRRGNVGVGSVIH